MKIKNSQLVPLLNCMSMLNTIRNKEGVVTFQPKYKNPGKVRYNLAYTDKALRAQFEFVNAQIQNAAKETIVDGKVDPKRQEEFSKVKDEIMAQEEDLSIRPIDIADLDLDNNDIPSDALSILLGTVIADDSRKV